MKFFSRKKNAPKNPDFNDLRKDICRYRNGRIDKMFTLLPEHKLFYTVVPKSGNTSIKNFLWSLSGNTLEDENVHKTSEEQAERYNLLIPSQLPEGQMDSIVNATDWYRFSFVRDPYTRTLSGYRDKILNPERNRNFLKRINWTKKELPSLEEFLEKIKEIEPYSLDWHFKPQHDLLLLSLINYNFIGKLENYHDDMKLVCEANGIDFETYFDVLNQKQNTTKKDPTKDKLSNEAKSLIEEIYHQDFERFNYAKR